MSQKEQDVKMEENSNETKDQTIVDVELPPENKLKRRSSIFRPKTLMQSFQHDEQNYLEKLKKEIVDWKNLYAKTKNEYLNPSVETTTSELPKFNDAPYNDYVKKLQNYCSQVNIALEMHKHLLNYKDNQIRELETLMKLTDKTIREKVNLK